jgi:hypothetical protein
MCFQSIVLPNYFDSRLYPRKNQWLTRDEYVTGIEPTQIVTLGIQI